MILEGVVDDALYGYAITSGDLDGDGFDGKIIQKISNNNTIIFLQVFWQGHHYNYSKS